MAFRKSTADLAWSHPDWIAHIRNLVGGDVQMTTTIMGIVSQESEWNPNAFRAEPAISDASYGLMQILLGTAHGYNRWLTAADLYDPATNLTYGTKFFMDLVARWGLTSDAIASYNAGSPRKNASGQYTNSRGDTGVQAYVDSVNAYQVYYLNQWPAVQDAVDSTPPPPPPETPPPPDSGVTTTTADTTTGTTDLGCAPIVATTALVLAVLSATLSYLVAWSVGLIR